MSELGGQPDHHRHREPDADGQPQRLQRVGGTAGQVAPAAPHRHPHRRPVGEEVEHPHERVEHRRGQRQPAERRGAELPDHRGVGEHVDRLDEQRPERRHRDGEDAPVERVDRPQPAHTLVSMARHADLGRHRGRDPPGGGGPGRQQRPRPPLHRDRRRRAARRRQRARAACSSCASASACAGCSRRTATGTTSRPCRSCATPATPWASPPRTPPCSRPTTR